METWLLAFKEFIFLFCLTNKYAILKNNSTNNHKKEKFQNLLMSVTSKNLETSRTKNPDSSGFCVSNIQSAALKWSDLRYKWQPDMQRDRIRNRRDVSAERCTAIVYIILSFLVSHHIVHRPMTERRIPCRLISEVTVVVLFVFFWHFFLLFISLSVKTNWITKKKPKEKPISSHKDAKNSKNKYIHIHKI